MSYLDWRTGLVFYFETNFKQREFRLIFLCIYLYFKNLKLIQHINGFFILAPPTYISDRSKIVFYRGFDMQKMSVRLMPVFQVFLSNLTTAISLVYGAVKE
jgi:hypothetical protein